MKKILSFLTFAWLGVLTCAAQNEWQEIFFTEAIPSGSFNGTAFSAENSDFSFTCTDASNKLVVEANTARFGTAESFQTYGFRMKTVNASPSFTFHFPADGILRFAARPANSKDETRKVIITQNEVELYNSAVKEADSVHVVIETDTVPTEVSIYEYHSVYVSAGSATLTVTNGINFYSFAFKEEAPAANVHYYLAGSMTNWKENMIEMEGAGNVYSTTLVLEGNTLYQYKIVKVENSDTTWYGVHVGEGASWEPMTSENCTGWWLNGDMNVGLQTTRAKDYTFRFIANEHKEMSVIYPSEWDEIVFTAVTPAGTEIFNDSTFRIPDSEFSMTCRNDAGKKFNTRQQTATFGTQEKNQLYNYNLQTGSSLNYLEFNIPADGIFRMAARSSTASDETRTIYVVQDGDTIFARAPKESEKVGSIYPYFSVYVRQGTIQVYDPSVLYYSFAFKEAVIPEAPHYYLAGSMTDWQNGMAEMEQHGIFYSTSLLLNANTYYEYKIVKVVGTDTTWYGNPEAATMTAENCSGWWLVGEQNVGLQTTRNRAYTFRLIANEHNEMSVIYPSEWDEIVFNAETTAGTDAFNDSTFTVPYSDFSMTSFDPSRKFKTVSGNYKFGDAGQNKTYDCYLHVSGTYSYLLFNVPSEGQIRIAARVGAANEYRNMYLEQDGDTILNQEMSQADRSADGYYPYHYAHVHAGTVKLTKSDGAIDFLAFAFKADGSDSTGVENAEVSVKDVKILRDGQIFILRGEKVYTVTGQEVK
ncbi:MAG: hypothetical protein IJQ18_01235 [Paludibacteraceae bacterium]|nr:hypothetical protein [Paludibacteraceae bacterium]